MFQKELVWVFAAVISVFYSLHGFADSEQLPLFPEINPPAETENKSLPPVYEEYYTIDDTSADVNQPSFWDPTAYFVKVMDVAVDELAKSNLSLLKWVYHKGKIGDVKDAYVRSRDFGTWIDDPTDNNCYDTRTKVLIRQSTTPVVMRKDRPCFVESGEWHDPYTDQTFTKTNEVDIDHVVPLKHLYDAIAWKWTQKKRCLYANFVFNDFHLLAVENKANRKKGDRSPDEYMPPNKDFQCQYIQNWLKIKLVWDVPLNPPESEFIQNAVKDLSCDLSAMTFDKQAFLKQRQLTDDMQKICE